MIKLMYHCPGSILPGQPEAEQEDAASTAAAAD